MAEDKVRTDQQEDMIESEGREDRRHMAEGSPNPHNEAEIIEIPVSTDQSRHTADRNVAQTASTRDGRVHPSVGESVGGGVADTDSMFNEADPQAAEADKDEKSRRNKSRKPA